MEIETSELLDELEEISRIQQDLFERKINLVTSYYNCGLTIKEIAIFQYYEKRSILIKA